MKKLVSSILILVFVLCFAGCGRGAAPAAKGDFSFTLPEGYSVKNVTGQDCSFVRDSDGIRVGGAQVTSLRKRDLGKKGTTEVMKYLQEEFHKTNNVEFFSFIGEGDTPFVNIHLARPDATNRYKRNYTHVFFLKENTVYHVWVDEDVLDEEIRQQILDSLW